MNNVGKNGVKVVERHIVTHEPNEEVLTRLTAVENRKSEVRRVEMSDALHRVALLEKQVVGLQTDRVALTANIEELKQDLVDLQESVAQVDAKPAQILRETVVERPGVTVHEHTTEHAPNTSPWVWVIVSLLTLAQVVQLWRLL
jgi:predicted RNase H-like nuclease (RuvC/YqgF family)